MSLWNKFARLRKAWSKFVDRTYQRRERRVGLEMRMLQKWKRVAAAEGVKSLKWLLGARGERRMLVFPFAAA